MLWSLDASIAHLFFSIPGFAILGLPVLVFIGLGAAAFYLTWREHHRK